MKITVISSAKQVKSVDYLHVSFTKDHDRTERIREGNIQILMVGLGKEKEVSARIYRTLVRRIVMEAQAVRQKKVTVSHADLKSLKVRGMDECELLRTFAENVHLANYAFTTFKKRPEEGWPALAEMQLLGDLTQQEKEALKLGEIVAEETNRCRDIANTPGGDMTPVHLSKHIQEAAKGSGAQVRVLGTKELEKLKMGALLGVGQGSKAETKFIIVEYWGTKKSAAPIVLVGKGITFDTGGLNLKPTNYILDMNLDMSGGAAVAHAVITAARLKLKVNAIALIPAAENMPSGESYRPGDILRSMSGKTIEVIDTDAEGRIVLADGLTYAKKYKPALVVDVATLTGAAQIALGTKASAVMSKDDTLAQEICALGEQSGDYCWPLPLWDEFKDAVKGRFGDLANIPLDKSRDGSCITGGMFLAEFAAGYPWVHIDMAPRMTSDKGDCLAPGAAGAPMRLLVRLLESRSSK